MKQLGWFSIALFAALPACSSDPAATNGKCADGTFCSETPPGEKSSPDGSAPGQNPITDAGADTGAIADAGPPEEVSDGGWVISPSLAGRDPIPSGFDVNTFVAPRAVPGPYGDGIAEGAFRFICEPGKLQYDDPIVYPGQPGKSHLHQFYGNMEANAFSTFSSLRKTGGSTCNWVKDANGKFIDTAVNRSAYWVPALLDGTGNVIQPDLLAVYYKRHTMKNGCKPTNRAKPIGTCTGLPHGLRYIFGRDMKNLGASLKQGYHYRCNDPGPAGGVHYDDLESVLAACPAGSQIIGWASAPSCWDGKHLDSPNHRDHMAYGSYSDGLGNYLCPSTHPYLIPHFELGQTWTVDGLDRSKIRLSSDDMAPGEKRGATYHADWWGAWDDDILKRWQDNCIEKGLDGSGGDLCNGTGLKGASQPSYGWTNPNRIVPVPPKPL